MKTTELSSSGMMHYCKKLSILCKVLAITLIPKKRSRVSADSAPKKEIVRSNGTVVWRSGPVIFVIQILMA